MSCPISFQSLKALPILSPPKSRTSFTITSKQKLICNNCNQKVAAALNCQQGNGKSNQLEPSSFLKLIKSNLALQVGLLATGAEPALAVTGVNGEVDLIWTVIQIGIVAFWYFLIMPPIIMNWLRIRWYRRNLLEMYLQFMCVFIFFPGVLLWAPFLNFRKFPRDPTLKNPWSKPENPSEVRGGFRKYPWATIEDYE